MVPLGAVTRVSFAAAFPFWGLSLLNAKEFKSMKSTLLSCIVISTLAGSVAQVGTLAQGLIAQGPNGHFYEVIPAEAISWDDANALATASALCSKSGHLVTITSEAENDFINSLREAAVDEFGGLPQYWVGGFQANKDDEPFGNWQWVNGEGPIPGFNGSAIYTNWADGEPNDCGESEEHLTIGRFAWEPFWSFDGSLWNDEGCGLGFIGGFIVEYDSDPTIVIDGCDSGVPNLLLDATEFCTLSDWVADCLANATNHGEFVNCVSHLTNALKDAGLISGKEKGAIQRCAAQANLP